MWLAGSFATLSPSYAYLYTLFGANRLPSDVFEEARCGTQQIGLFRKNGEATMETVTVHRTGLGELRLRVPVSRTMAVAMIALPLAKLAQEGILHGVTVQHGDSLREAAESQEVRNIARDRLVHAKLQQIGQVYRAEDDDGCLLIPVDAMVQDIAVYSIALTSLSHARILAASPE
jgi:hypothetical protein